MNRNLIFPSLLCAALLLFACEQPKEVVKDPEVLQIAPEKIENEQWRSHDIQFKVACDLDVEVELKDTPWASITETELTGDGQTTVTVTVEDNAGDEPRTGVLEAASGSKTFTAEFTQLALGSTLGVWNYDGRGANLVYDELCWQTSVRRYPNGMADSRLLDVVNGKYMVIKGIPVTAAVGSSITVNVQQNWINFLSWQREATFEVVRTAPDKIWLADLGTVYIVKL